MDTPETTQRTARVTVPANELVFLLSRALNCLDPKNTPKWAMDLCDEVKPTDHIEIKVVRAA